MNIHTNNLLGSLIWLIAWSINLYLGFSIDKSQSTFFYVSSLFFGGGLAIVFLSNKYAFKRNWVMFYFLATYLLQLLGVMLLYMVKGFGQGIG